MNILISCDDNYLRPSIVDEKKRFGDFEIDTMIGKNRRGTIMTTNDRCTHLVLIRRLAGKEATQLASTPKPLLGAGCKRKHERADTPVHSERHGFQRADG